MEHRLDRLVVRRTRPGRRRLGWLAVAVAADALGLGYGVHMVDVRPTGTIYVRLVVPSPPPPPLVPPPFPPDPPLSPATFPPPPLPPVVPPPTPQNTGI